MTSRIYEHQIDALLERNILHNAAFTARFAQFILSDPNLRARQLKRQTRHYGPNHTGSIDLEIVMSCGTRLLVENKIDAGYSVTRQGDPQPERYAASAATLRAKGTKALTVLVAPEIYLSGGRKANAFDRIVTYEALLPALAGEERSVLESAILQARTPYEPTPNEKSAQFFREYQAFAESRFPRLFVKMNPNGMGVRPTESRTIYFDVPKTLRLWPGLPRPRMSLQCRDGSAPSASVKIMLGGWASKAASIAVPQSLSAIGGYTRPAGRSLGIVIDTPQLDTQTPFEVQIARVERGLISANTLAGWWNANGHIISSFGKGS